MLRVSFHPPRFYFGNHRIHHSWPGFALILAGAILVVSDWHDRRAWWRDLHESAWGAV